MEILFLSGIYSLIGNINEISLCIDGDETPIILKRNMVYTTDVKDKKEFYYYNKLMEVKYDDCDPFDFMDDKYYNNILPNMLKWYREHMRAEKIKQLFE